MTPNELYALEPIKVFFSYGLLVDAITNTSTEGGKDYPFVQLLKENKYNAQKIVEKESKIELKTYMEQGDDDGKYGAHLFSIYFDNEPFAIVKNNGYSD